VAQLLGKDLTSDSDEDLDEKDVLETVVAPKEKLTILFLD
jgi:hypothetical protein